MKHIINTFLTFLLTALPLFSQMGIGIGQWRTHLAYNATTQIAIATDRIFALSDGSIYSVGKDDGSLQSYSKIEGLSDIVIHRIAYVEQRKVLVVGYENGNIDFITDNDDIINFPDIYNKNIFAQKNINDLHFADDHLFLAMPFGVVKVNVDRNEITDTYYFKNSAGAYMPALSITSKDDSLYVATSSAIYRAPMRGKNLANFANWTSLSNTTTSENIKALVHNSQLYLLHKSGSVSLWQNGTWSTDVYANVANLCTNDGEMLIIKNDSTINTADGVVMAFDLLPQMAQYDKTGDHIWVAALSHGVIRIARHNSNDRAYYKPTGPAVNAAWRMRAAGNKVMVVPGGRWDVPYGTPANVMFFENGQWHNILYNEIVSGFGANALDFVDIAINPADNSHFFVASWGAGIFEFHQNRPYRHYDAGNSIIGNLVGNLTFDSKQRLWLTNPMTSAFIKYAERNSSSEYTYSSIPITSSQSVRSTSELIVDRSYPNIKYLVVARGQTKFVALNDKGTDDTSDDEIFTTSQFIDQDGAIFSSEHFMSAAQDPISGSLWVGTTSGPIVLPSPHNVFKSNYRCQRIKIPKNDGTNGADYLLSTDVISSIAIDGNNRKWLGTEGTGVYLLSDDGVETITQFNTENSPILSNWIRSIAINDLTGEVFFATDRGIISYQGDAVKAEESYETLHAFPNPVRPDYHGDIAIKGLAENSVVKITDIKGNLVYETFVKGGMAVWNGKRTDGKRVSSGVYLAICITTDNTKRSVVKILVM